MLRAAVLFAILAHAAPAGAGDPDTPAVNSDTAERGTSPDGVLSVLAFAIDREPRASSAFGSSGRLGS